MSLAVQSIEAWNSGDRIQAYTLLCQLVRTSGWVDNLLGSNPPRDYMAMIHLQTVDGQTVASVNRPVEMV